MSQATRVYHVREMFYSLQGEGARAGTANVFLRFAGCNLQCSKQVHGFNCDTDFKHGKPFTLDEIVQAVRVTDTSDEGCGWVILTGGEPLLQVNDALVRALLDAGYRCAIETNGTLVLSQYLEETLGWVSVSPKRGERCNIQRADEVRLVVAQYEVPTQEQRAHALRLLAGHPEPRICISPAFKAPDADNVQGFVGSASDLHANTLAWCIELVKTDAALRLSVQQHKGWGVR